MANPGLPAVVEQSSLQLLDEIAALQTKFERADTAADKHEFSSRLAFTCFKLTDDFYAKAWEYLLLNRKHGWWKSIVDMRLVERTSEVVDQDTGEITTDTQLVNAPVQKWQRFDDYVADLLAGVKTMRRRSTQTRIALAEKLVDAIGVEARELPALMEDKTTLTGRALKMVKFDDFTGQVIGLLNNAVRARAMIAAGYAGEKVDDLTLIKTLMSRLAVAEHDEASAMIDTILPAPKIWLTYDAYKKQLVLHKSIRAKNGTLQHTERRFKCLDDDGDSDLDDWCMSKVVKA